MSKRDSDRLANHEIVTLAVFLLGGSTKQIDTEHIAKKANDLAPGRYRWRLYEDQINIEIIRAFLSDAKKAKYGRLLSGSGNEGWMLTEAGLQFAEQNIDRLDTANLSGTRRTPAEKNWHRRERQRMLSTSAFNKLKNGRGDEITDQEATNFFRIDEYVIGEARERKLIRIVNEFGNDPELGRAIQVLAERVRTGS